MARKANTDKSVAEDTADRPFVILEDLAFARHAAFDEALSLAQKAHRDRPDARFIVCRVLTVVEPFTTSKVTHLPR